MINCYHGCLVKLFGAFSAAAFYGAGEMFAGVDGNGSFFGTGLTPGDFAGKVLAHGMVGGVMSVLQGGRFGHGFAAAGVSQSFAGKINGMESQPARVATSAAIGGTVSEMTGGKFGNGATTAAFGRLFNEGMHAAAQKDVEKYFKHSTEHSPTKFNSSEMPGEVWNVLAGILDSPLGDGIRSGFENTGKRIDIVLSLSV